MYYDLIASLPQIPHFTRAERLPITRLRLIQRLKLLKPAHAKQIQQAHSLVRWRPERLLGSTDASIVRTFKELMVTELESSLRDYVEFRMEQQTLIAAMRRKQAGLNLPESSAAWGVGPRVHFIRKNWEVPNFGLTYVTPWFSQACELFESGDALGLERLLMDVAWRRLTQYAERNMFGFDAVFSYVFKWDILQSWLACDPLRGKTRFTESINQVTHVENN
jgi:Protein of unknown function (DUF2764)